MYKTKQKKQIKIIKKFNKNKINKKNMICKIKQNQKVMILLSQKMMIQKVLS